MARCPAIHLVEYFHIRKASTENQHFALERLPFPAPSIQVKNEFGGGMGTR